MSLRLGSDKSKFGLIIFVKQKEEMIIQSLKNTLHDSGARLIGFADIGDVPSSTLAYAGWVAIPIPP